MDKAAIAGMIMALFLCADATAEPMQAVSGMSRTPRNGAVEGADHIHLYAARNETEPFQVVISAHESSNLWDVKLELDELTGPNGAKISTISLYRQHYVAVTTPSPHSQFQAQDYPDALIPFIHPLTGAELDGPTYNGIPFDVAEGENQPVWVDIRIPVDTPAGDYHGKLRAFEQGLWLASLPVTLTVWDFTLPDVPALASDFGLNDSRVAQLYGLDRSEDGDQLTINLIVRSYYDLLLDHLLSPSMFFDTSPAADAATGKPDFNRFYPGLGTAAEGLAYYLDQRHASSYSYSFWRNNPFKKPLGENRDLTLNYLAGYSNYLDEHGWSWLAYMPYGFLDEPGSTEAYNAVRNWGQLYDEVEQHTGIALPLLITEQPEPEDLEWGKLDSFVDIWVPDFNSVMQDAQNEDPAIPRRLEDGDRVWSYTALANIPGKSDGVLTDSHPPKWLIDYAPINYRIPAWLNALHGISGLLYWDTLWWRDNVDIWEQAGNYKHRDDNDIENWGEILNGEGQLIYPGLKSQTGFDGPVASIRLKWLRESVEDFAYIQLLRDEGEWEFAKQQINTFAWKIDDWENNPSKLYASRQAMGEKLEQIFRAKNDSYTNIWAMILSGFSQWLR